MKNNILMIFIYSLLIICINCFCEGSHNRVDLSKKECARYEIEKKEVGEGKVEDYQCCYVHSPTNDLIKKECMVYSKNLIENALADIFEISPLNIFGGSLECSFRYISFNIISSIIILLYIAY